MVVKRSRSGWWTAIKTLLILAGLVFIAVKLYDKFVAKKQKAANRKYQADNVKKIIDARKGVYKSYRLALHTENDAKIIKQLDKQDNVTDYVRQLVTSDIKTDDVKEDNSRGEN